MIDHRVKFFDPGKAYIKHRAELLKEYDRVRTAGDLILRRDVDLFEENLAEFVGTKYAVALNSGTDALVLSLKAITSNTEIAVQSYTFKSTVGAVITSGNVPILYDLDVKPSKEKIGIVAHIAGEIFPMPETSIVIEDAAQALGAIKNPTSLVQTWSFYPAKILGAPGDAGAITTNDEGLALYVKEARNHFKTNNEEFGINSRMDNVWAAELNILFKYLPERIERRKEIAERYNKELKKLEEIGKIKLPNKQPGRVYQDFILMESERDRLYEFLKEKGLETIKNEYPFPPQYPKLPLAKSYEANTLRLPCNPELEDEEVDYVIQKIQEFYA